MLRTLFSVLLLTVLTSACKPATFEIVVVPQGSYRLVLNSPYIKEKFDHMLPGDTESVLLNFSGILNKDKAGSEERGTLKILGNSATDPLGTICKIYQLQRNGAAAVEIGMVCKNEKHTHGEWINPNTLMGSSGT